MKYYDVQLSDDRGRFTIFEQIYCNIPYNIKIGDIIFVNINGVNKRAIIKSLPPITNSFPPYNNEIINVIKEVK